jgi:hypothetical protein
MMMGIQEAMRVSRANESRRDRSSDVEEEGRRLSGESIRSTYVDLLE